jgi:hypothetical protein
VKARTQKSAAGDVRDAADWLRGEHGISSVFALINTPPGLSSTVRRPKKVVAGFADV